MKICDNNHDAVVFLSSCPVCEARKEIKRHERYQEILLKANQELMNVVALAIESQSWDANDPNENRWTEFYAKARETVRNGC